jgi:hypothetical protein
MPIPEIVSEPALSQTSKYVKLTVDPPKTGKHSAKAASNYSPGLKSSIRRRPKVGYRT